MSEAYPDSVNLTVIILTLNNADTIKPCIESVGWADEVLLYDSGSVDDTQSIAESLGARFIIDPDWSGFGVQRQKAQTHAKGKWLLWVDSDEVVSSRLKESIQKTLVQAESQQVFSINRLTDFFGRFIPFPKIQIYSR